MTLPETYRQRAKEQRDAANGLIDEPDILSNATKLISAIVGHVNASVMESLADVMDYQRGAAGVDSATAKRHAIIQRNEAIRLAAARGDWSEFDRLAGIAVDAGASSADGAAP
jgi:hypothetical protein